MWELVTRLLWLPLDIMQRISQRFLQLGRSVYGSLIAPAAKPAIKPTPPPTASGSPPPPPSNLFSAPFPVVGLPERNISSSPSSSSTIPACVTIDMESAEAANDQATKSAFPTTNYEQSSICTSISASAEALSSPTTVDQQRVPSSLILEAAAASELNPPKCDLESPSLLSAITNTDLSTISSSSERVCDVLVSGIAAVAADVDSSKVSIGPKEQTFVSHEPEVVPTSNIMADENEELKPVQVALVKMNREARVAVEEDDKGEWPSTTNPPSIAIDTLPPSVVRPDKRFREKEKRRQVNKQNIAISSEIPTNSNAEANDSQSSSEAKKPKLSEECEQPSTSSTCQDGTANNKDISGGSHVKKSKKRRSKKSKKGLEDQKESVEGGGDKMGVVERAPPPNFFIAIQIANKEILSNVAQLQKSLTERNLSQSWHGLSSTDVFRDAMVPVAKLHFTLHVMHLNGEEDLIKAQNALTECCSEVHQEFVENPMDLTIEGLGHFRNNVIFAQIKEKTHIDRLTKLSEIFRKKFKELNIPVDPRPFNPHMTIAKISRSNKLYKKKIRAFPSEMWSGCEQTSFGKQRVTGLQLLQMAGEDKATGYYQCFGQHYFEDPLLITPAASEWQNKKLTDDEDKDKISD